MSSRSPNDTTAAFDVVVLAGDRGPDDPLASHAGVAGKALVPVAGRPMLEHVLGSLDRLDRVGDVTVVCPGSGDYTRVLAAHAVDRRIDPVSGPAASAARALEGVTDDRDVLLATGDHPLLRHEWIAAFVDAARRTGADAAVGVVDHDLIARRFPGHRRTHYRFADVAVCGTNLFYFGGPRGREIVALWQRFETDRKKPWRIIARLGWWNLLRYATGRLDLAGATAALSARLGARVEAIRIADPEAAVDVDSPDDLVFAERLMAERGNAAS